MIHLFNGCKACAECPARFCNWCKDGPCGECFDKCGDVFTDLLNRPLGGFVFMAFWLGMLELSLCLYSAFSPDYRDLLKDCQFPKQGQAIGIHNWMMVQAGFAALNVLFAPYLQWMIWMELNEEAREPDDPNRPPDQRTRLANTEHGPVRASKQDVKEAFKNVFLYRFSFLAYFLALMASGAWSYFGGEWIDDGGDNCNPEDPNFGVGFPSYAAWTGGCFVAFVILYGMGWYCMMTCMDSQETLTLRQGVATGAAVMAATGRPIPGYNPLNQAGARGGSNQQGARQQAAAGVMGGLSNFVSGGAAKMNKPNASPSYAEAAPRDSNQFAHAGSNYNGNYNQPRPKSYVKSFTKLLACIGLDMMGNASYFIPAAGEVTDAVFAPASAVALKMMFNANGIALLGLAEELGPYTDIIPTATIAWFLETCAPDHPVTRCMGITPEWQMTGDFQR